VENIWLISDINNALISKAGSSVQFVLDAVAENILCHMEGLEPLPRFDRHLQVIVAL
jgi:sulfide:quinone oxidoreductase